MSRFDKSPLQTAAAIGVGSRSGDFAASPPLAGELIGPEACAVNRRDLDRITTGGSAVLLASVFGNGLSYLFGIYLARSLGSSDFGLYALGLTIFNMVTMVVLFGMDSAATKYVSEHLARGDRNAAHRTLFHAVAISLSASVIAAGCMAAAAGVVAQALYRRPELATVLLVLAAGVPFAVLSATMIPGLQAFQSVRATILIRYLWEPVGKFLLVGIALYVGFGLPLVIAALVCAWIVGSMLAVWFWQRLFPISSLHSVGWDWAVVAQLTSYCLPLSLATLFGVIAPRGDILLLGYWSSAQQVGVYQAAFQTASALGLILAALDVAIAPVVGRAWAAGDAAKLRATYRLAVRLSATVAVPLFLIMLLFSSEILGMFGDEFQPGAGALVLLAIGQLANCIAGSTNTVLLMTGRSRLVMINTIVFGILLFGLTALLVPLTGIEGAAVAAAGSLVALNVTRAIQVWKLLRVSSVTMDLLKPIAAGSLVAAMILLLRRPDASGSLLLAFLGCGLYLACLITFGLPDEEKSLLGRLCPWWRSNPWA